jgi:Mg2+-importing ATPase
VVELYKIRQKIQDRFEEISNKGFRVLGICYRIHKMQYNNNNFPSSITKDDEVDMTFLGFLIFFDPIKPDVLQSVSNLKKWVSHLK